MAAQLIRKSPLAMVQAKMPLFLSARVLIGGFAVVVAIGLLGLVAGLRNANRAEDAARTRFADAQALVALPPASTDAIAEDLASVKNQVATAEAEAPSFAPPPSGDAATTLLVRAAQAAGLAVKAIDGVAAGQTKAGADSYATQGVRMTVDGRIGQITAFLDAMDRSQPALVSTLNAMTLSDSGVGHAEIIFSTYTKIAPPTPRAVATPKGTKK